jgi:hypothetical protein
MQFEFIKGALSESPGVPSYSRLASGVIVLAVISWVSYVVFKTDALPDLSGALFFLTGGVGIHYGTNKASEIIAAVRGNKVDSTS